MSWFYGGGYPRYVSVGERKAKAAREVAKLAKKGQAVSPVTLEGRAIATTFWGKAWCDNLESYSDFENRLPRGRSYVRNGSVCDLQIAAGNVTALVCGTELYRIAIKIKPLPRATWDDVKARCAGKIDSLVELLQGRLSQAVMAIVTGRDGGLFPKPREIEMHCSCPDWADVCKHVAAALYGVGARLDRQPELLFTLRGVDHLELIAGAGDPTVVGGDGSAASNARPTIAAGDLADVFGIDLDGSAPALPAAAPSPEKPGKRRAKQGAKPRQAKTPDPGTGSAKRPGGGGKRKAPAPSPKARRKVAPGRQ